MIPEKIRDWRLLKCANNTAKICLSETGYLAKMPPIYELTVCNGKSDKHGSLPAFPVQIRFCKVYDITADTTDPVVKELQ